MATINVPADFPTIQAAINAAIVGDTIVVAPGTYVEQIVVNKTLTLLGAKAGIDARTRSPVGESIISFPTIAGTSQGVVRIAAPNIIFDGFTVNSSTTATNTFAIVCDNTGSFLPTTNSSDVTGLQIINNIITNNTNGVGITSIETIPLPVNYLVQFNYFANNSFLGLAINRGLGPMSNALVTQNLFDGGHNNFSMNIINLTNSEFSFNVSNSDSFFRFLDINGLSITGNVLYQTTNNSFNITDATNTQITNNLVYNSTLVGILLFAPITNVTISGNCIENCALRGIAFNTSASISSGLVITNNNIIGNVGGGLLRNGLAFEYSGNIDATNNYWGDPSGPNYNGGGPGTGQSITEPNANQIIFEPFLTEPITCPSPIIVTKTTTTVNVPPGNPVEFTYTVQVLDQVVVTLTSITDGLPPLNSGNQWAIISQNPPGTFTIVPGNPQFLAFNGVLPTVIEPGTYTVTIEANTNILDAGQILDNTSTTDIAIGGLTQSFDNTAQASVLICVHSSSQISMADGSKKKIADIQRGDLVITGEGQITRVVENVECVDGIYNRYYGACIIFEKDSVSPGIPSERFAIDANHPIALQTQYLIKGHSSLKPSRQYLDENKQIYKTYWDAVSELLPGPNRRYDLVLEDGHSYIANGIVIQSRQSLLEPGYDYNGGDYIDKIKIEK